MREYQVRFCERLGVMKFPGLLGKNGPMTTACGIPCHGYQPLCLTTRVVANWNAVVGHDDTVLASGRFRPRRRRKHIRSIFHRLNGIKRLVIGHDDRAEDARPAMGRCR